MSDLPDRTEVLVVGAGPVGLAVAASLAGHGHDVTVVDRQVTGANTSRAAVVHARTLEMLERIGVSSDWRGSVSRLRSSASATVIASSCPSDSTGSRRRIRTR